MNYESKYLLLRKRTTFPLLTLSLFLSACSTHVLEKQNVTIVKKDTAQANMISPQLEPEHKSIQPTQIKKEPSPFLHSLRAQDLALIKTEAKRTMLSRWHNIDLRSQAVRQRMSKVLNELNAPKELLYVPVAESGYNPYALSPAGAFGLWQLMPGTAIELGAHHRNGIDDRRHVEASTRAAVTYLLTLHKRFNSWPIAICAYNLGPWGVERRLRKKPWSPKQGLNALPFPAETRHYVKQILGMIALAEEGELLFSDPLPTQFINVSAPIDLTQMERISGLDKHELFRFNPAFDYQHYMNRNLSIHLPLENLNALEQALINNPDIFKPKFTTVAIKKGDSLSKIAHQHHTTVRHLKRINPHLKRTLSIGKKVIIPVYGSLTMASSKANPLLSKGRRIRYKVKSGDSLWKIAQKFGTSTRAIARTNQMSKKRLIRPGDRLWVIARFRPS